MKRIANFEIREVLDHAVPLNARKGDPGFFREYAGYTVKMQSHRYTLFKEKGLTCVECGITGTYFGLDMPMNRDGTPTFSRPHFNLYAVNEDGEEVLMTKDHILPKSKGGPNHTDNYQVMCHECNQAKGGIIKKRKTAESNKSTRDKK